MDRFSVFAPKILPRQERFLSGRRSCKGCAKALAARLVAKISDSADPALGGLNGHNGGLSANSFAHDRVTTADTIEKLIASIDSFNQKSARQSRTAHVPVKKPVIAIDRKILDTDYLVLQRILRNKNVVIICFDNEPVINSLIRKAIPRPFAHNDRNHPVTGADVRAAVREKNIPAVLATEDFAYIATACPSYSFDLIDKVKKGVARSGNAFILVMTPCPTGWIFNSAKALDVGRRAVLSGYFPLFEVENSSIRLTVNQKKRKPVQEYLALQKRFFTFPPKLLPALQAAVDEFYDDLQTAGTLHGIANKK